MDAWIAVLIVFATGGLIYGLTLALTPTMRRRMTDEQRQRAKLSPEHEKRLVGIVIGVACVIAVPLVVIEEPGMKLLAMLAAGLAGGAISLLYVRRYGRDRRAREN
jgi:hypothetical protein